MDLSQLKDKFNKKPDKSISIANLKYPIGEFSCPETISDEQVASWISDIITFPKELEQELSDLDKESLEWVYRPDGWTIREVVHHCADSHMNSVIRFKLALTEDNPTIKPYLEDQWALLADAKSTNLTSSLGLISSLHAKWGELLNSLNEKQLARTFVHPESGEKITLKENIGVYSWHCRHHLAHIRQAKSFKGAFK